MAPGDHLRHGRPNASRCYADRRSNFVERTNAGFPTDGRRLCKNNVRSQRHAMSSFHRRRSLIYVDVVDAGSSSQPGTITGREYRMQTGQGWLVGWPVRI